MLHGESGKWSGQNEAENCGKESHNQAFSAATLKSYVNSSQLQLQGGNSKNMGFSRRTEVRLLQLLWRGRNCDSCCARESCRQIAKGIHQFLRLPYFEFEAEHHQVHCQHVERISSGAQHAGVLADRL